MSFIWTDERNTQLRQMFSDRYSAAEIAEKFGEGLSRNAVCGKLSRLGLTRGNAIRVPKHQRKSQPAGSIAHQVISGIKRKRNAKPETDPAPFVCQDAADIAPRHLSLLELEDGECRQPYGMGPYTFCGLPIFRFKIDGIDHESSYCREHHRINHKPTASPKRAPYVELGRGHGGVFGRTG